MRTTWTPRGSFKPAGSSARSLPGAVQSDGTVSLVATTTNTTSNSIISVTDTAAFDATINATGTTIANAPTKPVFRGTSDEPCTITTEPDCSR